MRGFTLIWLGQLVSLLGTGMTRFALTIWAYQETGSATALALVAFFSFGPLVLLSPVAGALVDRWNRKLVVILSDLVAGCTTIILLLLYSTGHLAIWHLYLLGALAGAFEAFQFPAFSAAMTMMLTKEQYGRANGMMSVAESASGIVAPLLAGILLTLIGIGGVMTIDIVTFSFAVVVALFVAIPQPETTDVGAAARSSLWQESLFGFRYIWARPSLLGMQFMFFLSNLFGTYSWVLLAPLVLARTANNELLLGTIQSTLGIGGLLGGILLSLWGGPPRKVDGVLIGMIATSLLGSATLGLAQSMPFWLVGAFFASFFIPILNGSNQAIWQSKVAPDVQGRVFATRRLIAQITAPLAMLSAGPLADRIFGPTLEANGVLPPYLGWLVGVGPGAGIGLILAITGVLGAAAAVCGYLIPAVREIESRLPDYAPMAKEATESATAALPTAATAEEPVVHSGETPLEVRA
ncbi:MAG: MFS transporter [Caldilineaceae bacterium]|nr:MFS transporter [Caldilineaceae bacterium]